MTHFSEIRTARKRHEPSTRSGGCEVCRKAIEPGEKYVRFAATPHDEYWTCEGWTHLKAHNPWGSCIQHDGFQQVEEVNR